MRHSNSLISARQTFGSTTWALDDLSLFPAFVSSRQAAASSRPSVVQVTVSDSLFVRAADVISLLAPQYPPRQKLRVSVSRLAALRQTSTPFLLIFSLFLRNSAVHLICIGRSSLSPLPPSSSQLLPPVHLHLYPVLCSLHASPTLTTQILLINVYQCTSESTR
ncbi:hypothetical protein JAAARDRAFT_579857 [Jaapia argillacea MUCL 33604]|uniref:Uncharacterized protein n=1 Tax=Jaapia argillacea MUCL 33604 TaxID=933084 RepID=A0A067P6N9_9AGAM|nr:hypothetical protein JAAARDRAFT_579857 [Jaapia argillacea MUCL 33604]